MCGGSLVFVRKKPVIYGIFGQSLSGVTEVWLFG